MRQGWDEWDYGYLMRLIMIQINCQNFLKKSIKTEVLKSTGSFKNVDLKCRYTNNTTNNDGNTITATKLRQSTLQDSWYETLS